MKPGELFSAGSSFLLSVLANKAYSVADSRKVEAELKQMEEKIDQMLLAVEEPLIRDKMQSYVLEYLKEYTDSQWITEGVDGECLREAFLREKEIYLNQDQGRILEECMGEIDRGIRGLLDSQHLILFQELQDVKQILQENSNCNEQILNMLKKMEGSGREETKALDIHKQNVREISTDRPKENKGEQKVREKPRKTFKRKRFVRVLLTAACIAVMIFGFIETVTMPREYVLGTISDVLLDLKEAGRGGGLSEAEEKAYRQMAETYGFQPVKMSYVPEGAEFLEADLDSRIPAACFSYLYNGSSLTFKMIGSTELSSYQFTTDKRIQRSHTLQLSDTEAEVMRLQAEGSEETEYMAQVRYKDVFYIVVGSMAQEEFEKILYGLEFA